MDLFTLFLLAVGLSMDAFAVAICKGLAMKKISFKQAGIVGLWFGGFQALMPTLGFLLGTGFAGAVNVIADWIAFILLVLIGGNMIKEALSNEELSALGVLIFDYINTNLCWSVIKHNFMMGQYEGVCYCAHVKGYGWLQEVRDGVTAGTTGESRQMEAVKIWLKNMPEGAGISYCCHVQDLGWLPYVESGEVSGTTGKKKRMEAIRIKLVNWSV